MHCFNSLNAQCIEAGKVKWHTPMLEYLLLGSMNKQKPAEKINKIKGDLTF